MIQSFADSETKKFFETCKSRRFPPDIRKRSTMRLIQLNAATVLEDLRIPPSNRLEALGGKRKGQWSIRINEQWRICFSWKDGDAYDVAIIDYH
jgi:proteic killer suppression protein